MPFMFFHLVVFQRDRVPTLTCNMYAPLHRYTPFVFTRRGVMPSECVRVQSQRVYHVRACAGVVCARPKGEGKQKGNWRRRRRRRGAAVRKSFVWAARGTHCGRKGFFDDDTQHRINGSSALPSVRPRKYASTSWRHRRRHFRRNWPHHQPRAVTKQPPPSMSLPLPMPPTTKPSKTMNKKMLDVDALSAMFVYNSITYLSYHGCSFVYTLDTIWRGGSEHDGIQHRRHTAVQWSIQYWGNTSPVPTPPFRK